MYEVQFKETNKRVFRDLCISAQIYEFLTLYSSHFKLYEYKPEIVSVVLTCLIARIAHRFGFVPIILSITRITLCIYFFFACVNLMNFEGVYLIVSTLKKVRVSLVNALRII